MGAEFCWVPTPVTLAPEVPELLHTTAPSLVIFRPQRMLALVAQCTGTGGAVCKGALSLVFGLKSCVYGRSCETICIGEVREYHNAWGPRS
jgi:hypothetical protein